MRAVILTTAYNCEQYVEKCLYTISKQSVKDFVCYITNDMSTDGSVDKIKNVIQNDPRFVLIENKKKLFQSGNYDQVINSKDFNIQDSDVCIEVDGDDWLRNSKVLENILEKYESRDLWLANGSFVYSDGRPGFASPPLTNISIRNQTFTLSHIRTWKAFLWKQINTLDLKDDKGNYWEVAGDLAFMFPMFEMCPPDKYLFMTEVNYVYNESNPINEHKVSMDKVLKTAAAIRSKQPYKQLKLI